MPRLHLEQHRTDRIGWLRAAVLGANDGIVSTASLVIGVAAAHATHADVLVAGVAGLVAGAMSMAAGEYVSVSSQADTERADLARETRELATADPAERAELAGIYVGRGLSPELAAQVADQLMAHVDFDLVKQKGSPGLNLFRRYRKVLRRAANGHFTGVKQLRQYERLRLLRPRPRHELALRTFRKCHGLEATTTNAHCVVTHGGSSRRLT